MNRAVGLGFPIPYPTFPPSLTSHMVSVDVEHHERKKKADLRGCVNRAVGLGSHSLSHSSPVPNKPYGFCGRRAP